MKELSILHIHPMLHKLAIGDVYGQHMRQGDLLYFLLENLEDAKPTIT